MNNDLNAVVQRLPNDPGVYQFLNEENKLIYVGKAKNIKKRVSSYFNKASGINRKTLKLVSEIRHITYIISNTEFDALLLENNLIKENQPKYNILLKDDKSFPYLVILKEPFPRIISTRRYQPNSGEFFGPFTSVVAMKNVLELLRKLYTIRTCTLALTQSNIESQKFKVCLEYHIGNCLGPCVGLQKERHYNEEIEQARNILKGKLTIVHQYFKKQMQLASEELSFEKAQRYLDKLNLLEKFQSKSLVVNKSLTDTDVFAITSNEQTAFVNFMQIKEGAIIFSKSVKVKKKLDESNDQVLGYAIGELREQAASRNKLVLTNIETAIPLLEIEHVVPKIGDKKKLVDLCLKNAFELKKESEGLSKSGNSKYQEVLSILQKDMHMQELPRVIECFDNSNLQGSHPVASMVRFKDGIPDKKNYRHYNIRSVEGPNDFASMKEIVFRRYKRLLDENSNLPNLILVDGGKGQLSSAVEALKELHIYGKVTIAGIAKRLEEIYYPEDPFPLHINKKSPGLKLLQQLRDEAHRFAITFHRQKRSKATFKSELENIPGIGQETTRKLLSHFKSIKKIKEASAPELEEIVGLQKTRLLLHALKKS